MNGRQTTAADKSPEVMPASACRAESSFAIQPKLTIGAVNDPLEDEADAMADRVMRMPEASFIQRKCAHCEEEERAQRKPLTSFIQKKQSPTNTTVASDTVSSRIGSTKGSGHAMPEATKSFMESRFSADFSNINIHTGGYASQLSNDLHAQAFTVGNDIYFNEGKYSPESDAGKHLLAHELTHTLQQAGGAQIQKTGEEGSALIQDTVRSTFHTSGSNQWSGTVDREQYVPAHGTTPRTVIESLSGVRIEFDGDTCTVRLPTRVQFVHPSATNWPYCSADAGSPVPPPLAQSVFDDIKNRYIHLTNQWMNNWFRVELSNCSGSTPCRNINIEASITEVSANPTTTVIIANKQGRSCASPDKVVIHASTGDGNAITDDRLIHEGGHTVLGYLDEYPGAARTEAVHREDFSMAGSHSDFGTWMLAQERHFSFVPAFLQNIFPGCTARLVALSRREALLTPSLILGGTSFGGGGFHLGAGLDVGLPFDIQRRFQMMFGLRAHLLAGLDVPNRLALMGGVRAGLLYTSNLSSGGLRLGTFGEFGAGRFGATDRSGPSGSRETTGNYLAPYGAVGVTIGYTVPLGGRSFTVGAEGSYGSTFGLSAADVTRFGPTEWYNVGLSLTWQLR